MLNDLNCPYFLPELMVKFTRKARGHFVMLTQIAMLLITFISGHNVTDTLLVATLLHK